MPNSINGWPVLDPGSDKLATGKVPNANRRLTTRREALPLFLALAADYHRWVTPIDVGTVDDGGYSYRKSRINASWSNHSSGTAIDINWSREGSRSLSNRQFWAQLKNLLAVRRLKATYPILNWGGDWSDRYYDPMHWELKKATTVGDVNHLIAKLDITTDGVRTRTRTGRKLRKPLA